MIGETIKKLNYKIVATLGQGGMGTVYLAEHTLVSNEKVAIKVINANMVNDFTRKLLHDEAQRLATLKHPNIVAFKNYHIDEGGNIYLIMEYAEGKSLEDYIRSVSGLIVEDRVCPIFEPILDAVGYAHKKGILHCDIKPANVVITKEGTPKVLDFGISRLITKDGSAEPGDNVIMGTPSYMSPEQVKGEHLDARSDIYSLGVLLHQMLTGNAPYDTTTLTEHEINMKVVKEPLPRMRTYYKYVSDKVQRIVDKATAKNPDERFQSCEEFKKELHKAIYPWRPTTWMKIAAAAVVLLAVGTGIYVWDYNRVKTSYYKDYVERWGVPEGIGELSSGEHSHAERAYKFTYQKRKLLRVQHVNSLDYMIDDGESERKDRPVDQHFSYRADGNVDHVVVKDRSGKVLYVKSYNVKLNTMAFQYNDEHGTERSISNQTVGYVRTLDDNSGSKGRISRYWIEHDDEGFATTIKYAWMDNTPACDENGIYGQAFTRDDKGRPIEIRYIGIDDNPQPTKWGLGMKKFYYDEDDNWVKAAYLTIDGKPALDAPDGVAVFELEYDEYGNVTYALHKSASGELMLPKMNNVAGIHSIYDERGFEVTTEYLGVDKKPMFVKGLGFAIVKNEYDDHGYVCKRSYCDPEGKPTTHAEGNASVSYKNDAHGNTVETWSYGLDGKLCLTSYGYAGVKIEYDSIGNQIKTVAYGIDKKPCQFKEGYYGWTATYDKRNLTTQTTHLGKDLKPGPDNNNVIIAKFEYDKRGNQTRTAFYEADGKTMRLSNEGCAGWNDVYDDRGNHVERNFFDTKGKPNSPSGMHYAKIAYTYDENNNLSSYKYYNLEGRLTYVDGIAGKEYVNDNHGNTLEDKPIGTDGKLAPNYLVTKKKYDKYGNCTEEALFDASGPDCNSVGVHKYAYAYNSRNDLTEERFYGTNGKLAINTNINAAIRRREYNEKGEPVKLAYFGTDCKPCVGDEGWSSKTVEYDQYGNIAKENYFGTDGKPTDPKVWVPVGIAKYDKWGNRTYVAAQDGYGKFINVSNDSYAIKRMTYDRRSNILSESYFNANDKPTRCKDGYSIKKAKYDDQNRMTEQSYYDTDGKPMLVNGVHIIKNKYDMNTGNMTEESCYGTNGKPIDSPAGFHRAVYTYNESGTTRLAAKLYRANGTLLASMRWNGSQWVMDEQPFDWQARVRELQKDLPVIPDPDFYNLCFQSLKITGSNSCVLTATISSSASSIPDEHFKLLKEAVAYMAKTVEEELKHKAYVTATLYDKDGTKIYSARY